LSNRFAARPKTTGLLFAIALLALAELAGHAAYRLRRGHFLWDQPVTSLFDPYAMERHAPGVAAGLGTDRHGFVHNGYDRDLRERGGRFLIFVLGGSTVEGLGVANDETIPAQLETMLNAKTPDAYWVVNAGYHGHISYQELGVLSGQITPRFKPDLVIALDGRNDGAVGAAYKNWRPNWQPYYDLVETGVNAMRDPPLWVGAPAWFMRRSAIVKAAVALRVRLRQELPGGMEKPDVETPISEAVVDEVVAAYFANLAAAEARTREIGVPFIAFLQPTLIAPLRPRMTPFEEAELLSYERRIYGREGMFRPGMESFYKKASERGRGRRWFHDLSGLLANAEGEPYVDSCHYSKDGGKIIARAIYGALLKDGLLEKRP